MDCPHCNEENLIGARICGACGQSMLTLPTPQPGASPTRAQAPPWQEPTQTVFAPGPRHAAMPDPERADVAVATEDSPAGERGPSLPVQAMCRVCMNPFDRKPQDKGAPICSDCRSFAPTQGGDAGPNDIKMHPATQDQPGVDPRLGMPMPRMKPVAKKVTLRAGPVAAVAGAVLVAIGMGVTSVVTREKDPVADYLADAKPEDAPVVVIPAEDSVTRLESTLKLTLVHDMVRASFSSRLEDVVRLDQKSVQTLDVAFLRDDPRGTFVDVASECRVAEQTGVSHGNDGREAEVYPFRGHKAVQHLVVGSGIETAFPDGTPAVAGRDIVPCLTAADVGAPAGTLAPGATWKHVVRFPFLTDKEGRLLPAEFPCELTYAGRRIVNGYPCFVFGLKSCGQPVLPHGIEDMNRSRASIRAAIFYEAKTGLLVEAHAFVDVAAWLEKGRVEDRVSVTGTMDIRRR